jgi:PHD/YefM family antitoxin component YafN of YafNO toxin-antitoxin module
VKSKIKQFLIDRFSKVSASDPAVTLDHEGKPVAVVLSAEDYQKFQHKREEKLQTLKTELQGILSMIRTQTRRRSLAEVEASLAALKQQIEQEIDQHLKK